MLDQTGLGGAYLSVCARFLEEPNSDQPSTKLVSILPITTSLTGETLFDSVILNILNEPSLQRNFGDTRTKAQIWSVLMLVFAVV